MTQALEALGLRSKLSLTSEANVSAGSTKMARHLLPVTKEIGVGEGVQSPAGRWVIDRSGATETQPSL